MVLVLLLSGCRAGTDGSSSAVSFTDSAVVSDRDYLTLLYSASDTLNPYTAKTDTNRQLCKLLFEPLIKLDNEFNITYSLTQRAEVKGNTCTVTLKSKTFSDGTAVTAADVAYSFGLAKNSSTEYAHKLYAADSATASGSDTVVFRLQKSDPYFANLLDFPIIKKGSESRTDSDGVILPPIGSGRYVWDGSAEHLILNTKSVSGSCAVREIRLIDAPDSESLSHYVEVGAADMYYSDISDGRILRMSGKKININLNRLIYIGVNLADADLAQNELRQAISAGIDRKAICSDAYYNNAIAATGFYNPVWKAVKSVQNIEIQANQEITVENLEKIGYNSLDDSGVRKNGGKRLRLNLLVNKENVSRTVAARLVASQLSSCGISVRVVEKPYADYLADLQAGNFQLYLAETAVTPNMDLTNLIAEGGSAAFGIRKPAEDGKEDGKTDTSSNPKKDTVSDNKKDAADGENADTPASRSAAELLSGFYAGQNSITDIASVLQSEMPFIPICYRTGVLFCNDKIENVNQSSASDIYFSIESYTFRK